MFPMGISTRLPLILTRNMRMQLESAWEAEAER